MNIPEAIETNEAYLERYGKGMLSWEKNAQKLGIEALRDKASYRKRYPRSQISLLPGETKEVTNEPS